MSLVLVKYFFVLSRERCFFCIGLHQHFVHAFPQSNLFIVNLNIIQDFYCIYLELSSIGELSPILLLALTVIVKHISNILCLVAQCFLRYYSSSSFYQWNIPVTSWHSYKSLPIQPPYLKTIWGKKFDFNSYKIFIDDDTIVYLVNRWLVQTDLEFI